ncbi:MAG: DinB family protein [Chloroflexi bacterium]|nr:DinB family protein [Chloroflexota bacterium]
MKLNEFIEECLEDYRRRVYAATAPLSEEEMHWRPDEESNSIAFIIWHTARVEDRLINVFARGADEVWQRDGWSAKTGIPEGDHGVNYTLEQVSALPPITKEQLKEYFDAVREETLPYIRTLNDDDFDVVPEDRSPFPENPASVRYFSGRSVGAIFRQLVGEVDQHLGQVSFIRGLKRGFGN